MPLPSNTLSRLPSLMLEISTEVVILFAIFGLATSSYNYSFALFLYILSLFWEVIGLQVVPNKFLRRKFHLDQALMIVMVALTSISLILAISPTTNEVLLLLSAAVLILVKMIFYARSSTESRLLTTRYKIRGLQFLSLFAVGAFALGTNLPDILGTMVSFSFIIFVLLSYIASDILTWRCSIRAQPNDDCYQTIVRVNGAMVLILFTAGILAMTYADLTGQYPTGNFFEKLQTVGGA